MKAQDEGTGMPPAGKFPFIITQDANGAYGMHAGDIGILAAIKMKRHGLVRLIGSGNVKIDNERRKVEAGSALWPDFLKAAAPGIYLGAFEAAPQGIAAMIVGDYARSLGYASDVRMSEMLE